MAKYYTFIHKTNECGVPSTGQFYRWLLGCGPHVE